MASNGQTTLSPSDAVSDTGPVSTSVTEDCLRIVERRRSGELTTSEATIQLYNTLPDDERSESALKLYIDGCTEIDAEHAAAVRGGRWLSQCVRSAGCADSGAGPSEERGVAKDMSDEFESETDTDSSVSFTRPKRRHSDSSGSDSSARSRKHPKRSAFSWHHHRHDCVPADSSARKTLSLKANHLLDLKAAKNDLISQLDCPDFPDSLWTDILANRFIDLDKVYSGYYSLESDHKLTESVRTVDITLSTGGGVSKPTKTVETHGEWSIAFAAAKHAILYVFPHRSKELPGYEEYVIRLFAAVRPSSLHYRVLNLDKAIRVQVAKDNQLTLTSFAHFSDLSTRHLIANVDDPNSARNRRVRNASSGQQPICKRFNAGRCTSELCKYRHQCFICYGRHPIKDCGNQKRNEASRQ
jgi:hypothetical protein